MQWSRSTRRVSLWLTAAAFLCVQLATAAYACPALSTAQASMPGCDGMAGAPMDDSLPTLCKLHCDKDKQSPAGADTPSAAAPLPALLSYASGWRIAENDRVVRPASQRPESGPPRGAPPLFITYLVLRN